MDSRTETVATISALSLVAAVTLVLTDEAGTAVDWAVGALSEGSFDGMLAVDADDFNS